MTPRGTTGSALAQRGVGPKHAPGAATCNAGAAKAHDPRDPARSALAQRGAGRRRHSRHADNRTAVSPEAVDRAERFSACNHGATSIEVSS
jgi:hypothetical protein